MLCSWVLCYSLVPSCTVLSSPRRAVMWEGRVCGLGVGDESGERNVGGWAVLADSDLLWVGPG
jgi:hypothetical protein